MKRLISIFVLIPILIHAKSLPDWTVTGKDKKYPEMRYLTALGIGPTKQAADNQARGEIAKVFNARVKAESQDVMSSTRKYASKSVEVHSEEMIKDITKVSTDKTLKGIEIKETAVEDLDNDKKKYYSLAVLDKIKMQNNLSSEILDIDKAIDTLTKKAEEEKDLIKKIKYYAGAIHEMLKRNIINTDLKIVDPTGVGIDSKQTLSELNLKLSDILTKDFRMSIELSGNNTASVGEALTQGITNQGFIIEDDKEKSTALISGDIELKEIPSPLNNEGWRIFQYTASFRLVDTKTKNQLGADTVTGKATQLSEAKARESAIENLRKDILEKVTFNLTKYLIGSESSLAVKKSELNV